MKRILFVRMDRIGDLVLSLPIDQTFRDQGADVIWWITEGLGFICEQALPQRRYQQWSRPFSIEQFNRAVQMLEALKPDAAVVIHAPWWIGLALWVAKVPVRAGTKSQWHSFLFFNRGVRQKRSQALMHEMDYNFQLLESSGLASALNRTPLKLVADEKSIDEKLRPLLKKISPSGFVVVHPGMSGSALNWSSDSYIDLIDQTVVRSDVVITGTLTDQDFIAPLRVAFANHPRVHFLDQKLNPQQLLLVLAKARAVVAPSTGVMHLAASIGVPTLGLFSPVRVQKSLRWGPRGPKTHEFSPSVQCPGELSCLGIACNKYPCMKLITPTDVSLVLNQYL